MAEVARSSRVRGFFALSHYVGMLMRDLNGYNLPLPADRTPEEQLLWDIFAGTEAEPTCESSETEQ